MLKEMSWHSAVIRESNWCSNLVSDFFQIGGRRGVDLNLLPIGLIWRAGNNRSSRTVDSSA